MLLIRASLALLPSQLTSPSPKPFLGLLFLAAFGNGLETSVGKTRTCTHHPGSPAAERQTPPPSSRRPGLTCVRVRFVSPQGAAV